MQYCWKKQIQPSMEKEIQTNVSHHSLWQFVYDGAMNDTKDGMNALVCHKNTKKYVQAAWKYNKTGFSLCVSGQLLIESLETDSSSSKLFSAEDQVLKTKTFRHCKYKYIL